MALNLSGEKWVTCREATVAVTTKIRSSPHLSMYMLFDRQTAISSLDFT